MSNEVAIEKKKLRPFSKEWFKSIASALNFKDYSARDWAINTVSSACSYSVAGISAWVKFGLWPTISTSVKAFWAKTVALLSAMWTVGRETF